MPKPLFIATLEKRFRKTQEENALEVRQEGFLIRPLKAVKYIITS